METDRQTDKERKRKRKERERVSFSLQIFIVQLVEQKFLTNQRKFATGDT
jgi:hypothetical protein